jgi:hypothetical protein
MVEELSPQEHVLAYTSRFSFSFILFIFKREISAKADIILSYTMSGFIKQKLENIHFIAMY